MLVESGSEDSPLRDRAGPAKEALGSEQVKLADLKKGMHVAIELGLTHKRIAVKTIRGQP
jgi:hypothetical protein